MAQGSNEGSGDRGDDLRELRELLDRQARAVEGLTAEVRALHERMDAVARREFHQYEALLNLHRLVSVRAAVPPSREWAASPDFLLLLASLVQDLRPRLVVELGSGTSTVWLAYALEAFDAPGRVVSIDHEARFCDRTRDALGAHRLDHLAEVRQAPLIDLEIDGKSWRWYDQARLADLAGCDLLVVDGPPGDLATLARYPALPLLHDILSPYARVVVDDYQRPEEREMVARWLENLTGWELVEYGHHEKGTAVLARG